MKTFAVVELPSAQLRLIGGCLCLDFANTVGGRRPARIGKRRGCNSEVLHEKLTDNDSLMAWAVHAGVLSGSQIRRVAMKSRARRDENRLVLRALALREGIYRVFKSIVDRTTPPAADLELLNREIGEARRHERLHFTGGRFEWESVGGDPGEIVLWQVARSAGELLTSGNLSRIRECGGEDCGWLFLDTSKNQSRQWCYMQGCGNLAKVRRFRQRQGKRRSAGNR
jgi:predicted RNA-binding Zn ribbon-like protein